MEIRNAIVHLVQKQRHQPPTLQLRSNILPIDDNLRELIVCAWIWRFQWR
jgi:nucleoid-associated protein YejK